MNAANEATREIYWNVTHVWVMYALLLPAAAVAGYGVYRHVGRWRQGRVVAFRQSGRARLAPADDDRADARRTPVGVVASPRHRLRLRRVGALHEVDARLHRAAQHLRGQPRAARRVAQTS